MRRPRFKIRGLLVFVVFLAVGLAALREASEAWDGGVLGLTLLVLLASVLLAVHRTGTARAYWLGFALFGWAYFALLEVPAIAARLPTTWALTYLDSLAPGRSIAMTGWLPNTTGAAAGPPGTVAVFSTSTGNVAMQSGANGNIRLWNLGTGAALGGSTEHFIRIGHSLLALILGLVGAVASRSLHLRERRGPAPTTIDLDDVQETSTSSPTS